MVQTGGAGHLSLDTASGAVTIDLSGTYDWKAQGNGSVDPQSGLEAISTDLADFTTLSVGSDVITFDVSATGAAKVARLALPLTGLPSLPESSLIFISADIDLDDGANNYDTLNDQIVLVVGNETSAETEGIYGYFYADGIGNVKILVGRTLNTAYSSSANTTVTNGKNAGRLQVVYNIGHQYSQFYEASGNNLTQSGALTQTTHHCRAGSGTYFQLYISAADGGQVKGTISNIKIMVQ